MQYRQEAAGLLDEVIKRLTELDELSERCVSHRLGSMGPLRRRLEAIRDDLKAENRLLPAMRQTTQMITCLLEGPDLRNPKYRSLLARLLGSYQKKTNAPAKARLGGLRGGRPRKDGKPVRTLESKGYSAAVMPPPKGKGVRSHPDVREYLRGAQASV